MYREDYSESDSSYHSDYGHVSDDLMVLTDENYSPSESEEGLSDQNDEEDFDDEEDVDLGPWEEYTYDKMLDDKVPNYRRRYKARGLLQNLEAPIDFFNLFLDEEFLEEICEKSAQYYIKNRHDPRNLTRSHKKKWKKPDLIEIRAFFGLLLTMGLVSKPKIEDYWSKDPLTKTPGFSEVMSHDHFTQILRCLVFYDIENRDIDDPLYKVRKLINHIVSTSLKLYDPDKYLTIDESMIKYNGRSCMKVYMPTKPIKYGFKVYMMTDSCNSYVLNWMMHTKKMRWYLL